MVWIIPPMPSRPWSISIIWLYLLSVNQSSKMFKEIEPCEFSEHRDQKVICMQTRFYVTFLLLWFILLRHNFSEVITTGTAEIHVMRCSASATDLRSRDHGRGIFPQWWLDYTLWIHVFVLFWWTTLGFILDYLNGVCGNIWSVIK